MSRLCYLAFLFVLLPVFPAKLKADNNLARLSDDDLIVVVLHADKRWKIKAIDYEQYFSQQERDLRRFRLGWGIYVRAWKTWHGSEWKPKHGERK